jgi:hypothetical protein
VTDFVEINLVAECEEMFEKENDEKGRDVVLEREEVSPIEPTGSEPY